MAIRFAVMYDRNTDSYNVLYKQTGDIGWYVHSRDYIDKAEAKEVCDKLTEYNRRDR